MVAGKKDASGFDEFGDEPEMDDLLEEDFLEDDLLGDETDGEWEEDLDEDFGEEGTQPVAKKKKSNLVIIIAGVAVLLGGGVFVFGMGGLGGSSKTTTDLAGTTNMTAGTDHQGDNQVFGSLETDASNGLPDFQPRRVVPSEVDNPPQPKPFSQTGAGDTENAPEGIPARGQLAKVGEIDPGTIDNGPLTPFPSMGESDDIKPAIGTNDVVPPANISITPASVAVVKEDVTAPAPVKPPVSPKESMSGDDASQILARLEELSDRMDSFENSLSDMSSRVKNANSKVEISAEVKKLSRRLSSLERKLENGVKASNSSSAGSSQTYKTQHQTKTASVNWELRAAQPGRAWVSSSAGGEMRTVNVGDYLEGIGKVTSVSYSNGVWIVQGTKGRIKQ